MFVWKKNRIGNLNHIQAVHGKSKMTVGMGRMNGRQKSSIVALHLSLSVRSDRGYNEIITGGNKNDDLRTWGKRA